MESKNNNNNESLTGSTSLIEEPVQTPIRQQDVAEEKKVEQTVTFISASEQYSANVNAGLEGYADGAIDTVPISQFLERPIKIDDYTWTVNTSFTTGGKPYLIDIWTLWQSNPAIKAKLENYAFLRCKLHVKIVPSCTPFQYGKLMVNYVPYAADNEIFDNMRNVVYGTVGASDECYLQYMSTYPITGYIDAASNNTLELEIPFVYHKNYLPVAGDPTTAKVSLGSLSMTDLNVLSRANTTASTTANIALFVWATDIQLQVPTDFVPTAGKGKKYITSTGVKDEIDESAEKGVISGPASAVAEVAGRLSDVPVIGPFAKATQIGASAVSGIARIFGFSNPHTVVNVQPFYQKLYRNLATTTGTDTAFALSLDEKQELNIDSRTIGWTGTDEMALSGIISKEQWITKGKWLGATGQFVTAGAEPIILSAIVQPIMAKRTGLFGTIPDKRAIQLNPAGHIARMFNYWKGKIIFRIEVVASPYHKGVLQVQFDPMLKNGALAVSDVYTGDVNTRHTIFMDISEHRELEIEIDFVNNNPYLKCRSADSVPFAPNSYADTTFALQTAKTEATDLGMLTVSVLNELVAPGDTALHPGTGAGVDVNLYMRCHSDLEFQQPIGGWEDDLFVPTSTDGCDWQQSVMVEVGDSTKEVMTFFGERIVSLRSLLKRPTIVFNDFTESAPGGGLSRELISWNLPHFAPENIRPALLSNHQRRNCYESFLAPAFLAKRGSMRWKVGTTYATNQGGANGQANGLLIISRRVTETPVTINASAFNVDTATMGQLIGQMSSGTEGIDMTLESVRPSVDVQVPFYSNTRFALACSITNVDLSQNIVKNPTMNDIPYETVNYIRYGASIAIQTTLCSVGEDYSLFMYQAPPTLWEFV